MTRELQHLPYGVGRKTKWYTLNQTANYAFRFRYEEYKTNIYIEQNIACASTWVTGLGSHPT